MKLFKWLFDNILFVITAFLLAFIPLYPKLPILDVVNTWVYIRLEDFIVALVFLLWLVLMLLKRISIKTPLTVPIIIFWIIGAISTLHGAILIFPLLTGVDSNVALLNYLRRIEYLSLFFVAYSAIKDKRSILHIVAILVITLILVVGYGVGQKYLGFPAYLTMNEEFAKGIPMRLSSLSRVPSTFGGHYDLAAYLVLVIPILSSMIFAFRSVLVRFSLSIAVFSGFVLLFMTVSRVSFFVLLLSMILMLILQKKKLIIASMVLGAFIFLSFFPTLLERFGNTVKEVDVLVESRTGKVFGNVREVDAKYFEDKIVKKEYAQDEKNLASSSAIVPLTLIPPKATLLVESNKPTGENLPQGTSYVNLPLSPIVRRVEQFFYQRAGDKESEVFVSYGSFIVKRAKAFDLSFTTRFQGEWPKTIQAFKRNILFGSGYGSVGLAVDNNYLRILGEVGIFGFLSYFALFLITGIYIKRVLPDVDSSLVRSFVLGFVAGVFGLALNAILIDVFEASKIAFLFWLLTGIVLGILHLYQSKSIDIPKEFLQAITSTTAIIIYLFVFAFVAYSPVSSYYFVGDDFTWFRWIADCNKGITDCQSPISAIFRFFTESSGFFYRPGTKIYFLIMYSLFWLDQSMFHTVSIFLHATVAALLFLISKRLLKNDFLAGGAGLLFLILSGFSESVFWISSTGFLFNAALILFSLYFYILSSERKKNIYFIFSCILGASSLLFHELGVISPLLIFLYVFVVEEKVVWEKCFRKSRYLFLLLPILPYFILRYLSHSHWFNGDYSYNLLRLPYNIVGNTIGYLTLTLFGPQFLSFYQKIRDFARDHLVLATFASLLMIFASIVLYKIVIRKMSKDDKKILIFGFSFFLIALLPFVGLGNISSRYSYLASIGLVIVFVFFLKKVYGYFVISERYIAIACVVALTSIFLLVHLIQLQKVNKDWYEAGEKSKRFLIALNDLYTDYPANNEVKFYFVNMPIRYGEAWVFPVGLNDVLWLVFRNKYINAYQSLSVNQAINYVVEPERQKVFEFDQNGEFTEMRKTQSGVIVPVKR